MPHKSCIGRGSETREAGILSVRVHPRTVITLKYDHLCLVYPDLLSDTMLLDQIVVMLMNNGTQPTAHFQPNFIHFTYLKLVKVTPQATLMLNDVFVQVREASLDFVGPVKVVP